MNRVIAAAAACLYPSWAQVAVGAGAAHAQAPAVAPCVSVPRIAVVDTQAAAMTEGAGGGVRGAVTSSLWRAAEAMGYAPVPQDEVRRWTAATGKDAGDLEIADLVDIARGTAAQRAVLATIHPEGDTHVVDVKVVSSDGVCWCARGGSVRDIPAAADALARTVLPPPLPSACAITAAASTTSSVATRAAGADVRAAPASAAVPRGWRLALQTESAFGATGGSFYNHLIGGRLDYRFSPAVSLGGYLGYVNLKGKEGRAHGVLSYAQLEYRLMITRRGSAYMPLRFGTGYLPNNGPLVRLATGVGFALSPTVDLVAEFLAPMIWITRDQMVASMNVALELAFRL